VDEPLPIKRYISAKKRILGDQKISNSKNLDGDDDRIIKEPNEELFETTNKYEKENN
jgi:hypothetical protein